jgi:hypothetical protein
MSPAEEELAAARARAAAVALARARAAHASYLAAKRPSPSARSGLAAHAIRLAKLDVVYRAGWFDPTFDQADPEDVKDLLALLKAVPFDRLIDRKVMLLNPTFGEASLLVGGADADLIAGDMLIDFKTTK